MKLKISYLLAFVAIFSSMVSCSADTSFEEYEDLEIVLDYNYSAAELETITLINDYRGSKGLNALDRINHLSHKAEVHNKYMINNNVVNHDGFDERSKNIIKVLKAKKVSENIAYNYNSPKGAFDAWLLSDSHRKNIEGDYTHFGISIRENPANGKKYYTNILAKI